MWLETAAHRKRLYQLAAVVGAALVAAGVVAPDAVAHVLDVLGGLLFVGQASTAARNVVDKG